MKAEIDKPGFARRRLGPEPYLFFLVSFALIVVVSHVTLLDLPFFWDELGQFVPAALDLYQQGAWVPRTTTPNVHPPGIPAYLALVWHLAGYSIAATRLAMLALASLAVLVVFLLAIELCRDISAPVGFAPPLLLVVSPLFFAQAMMAQLDMPAMLFTALALLLFLQERYGAAALACVALVLVKETGLVAPAVFAFWLAREKRWKQAALFVLPLIPLAAWLVVLYRATGHPLGNQEFTEFNLAYPLHPARALVAVLRRLSWLLVENFHWVGTISIVAALGRSRLFRSRSWRIAGLFAAGHLAAVTLVGGAVLERYLLPVLPLFYIAVAAGWSRMPAVMRRVSEVALFAGLLVSNFWNPPFWPFPMENNLAMTDFVRLQETAAQYLERHHPNAVVASAWPFTDAVRRPEFGYVERGFRAVQTADFRPSQVRRLDPMQFEVYVLFCRSWDPPRNLLRLPWMQEFAGRYFGYEPPIRSAEVQERFGLVSVARWERGGQWIEILARQPPARTTAAAGFTSAPLYCE